MMTFAMKDFLTVVLVVHTMGIGAFGFAIATTTELVNEETTVEQITAKLDNDKAGTLFSLSTSASSIDAVDVNHGDGIINILAETTHFPVTTDDGTMVPTVIMAVKEVTVDFSVSDATTTILPMHDEITNVATEVLNDETTIAPSEVIGKVTMIATEFLNDEKTIAPPEVIDKVTMVAAEVLNDETTIAPTEVIDKVTMVATEVLNDETTITSPSVMTDKVTTDAAKVLNGETTVTPPAVVTDKVTMVGTEVLHDKTTTTHPEVVTNGSSTDLAVIVTTTTPVDILTDLMTTIVSPEVKIIETIDDVELTISEVLNDIVTNIVSPGVSTEEMNTNHPGGTTDKTSVTSPESLPVDTNKALEDKAVEVDAVATTCGMSTVVTEGITTIVTKGPTMVISTPTTVISTIFSDMPIKVVNNRTVAVKTLGATNIVTKGSATFVTKEVNTIILTGTTTILTERITFFDADCATIPSTVND